MNNEKKRNPILLIPVAMMFTTIGFTFDESPWLQYTFMGISIILCIAALVVGLKDKRETE